MALRTSRADGFIAFARAGLAICCACALSSLASAQEPETPLREVQRGSGRSDLSDGSGLRWEGAIGLIASSQPEYAGASRHAFKILPALFVRYGRFTVTNASGFVTRRSEDVVRGLGIDLQNTETLKLSLGLRYDPGRSESVSSDLAGMGDVKSTVRVRLSGTWWIARPWRLGASWSVDAFGRGGGNFGDISAAWENRVAPATTMIAGSSLSLAGDRYLQTYYGVSEEQAARSRYPVYTPGSGLRDASLFVNLRHDFGKDLTSLAGASLTRILGPAADSPIAHRRNGAALNAGLAWRF